MHITLFASFGLRYRLLKAYNIIRLLPAHLTTETDEAMRKLVQKQKGCATHPLIKLLYS